MTHARRTAFRARTLGAAVVLGAALALSGCGFDAQTLQTYTPAHGVNLDTKTVKVRNLLIVADTSGQGVLSGSFVSEADDTLNSVKGTALKADGSDGSSLSVTGGPVAIKKIGITVLTAGDAPVRVSSPDLKPGLLAKLDLSFASGLTQTITVPVLDAADPTYKDIDVKAPAPTPTPTPAPADSPTPTPEATPAG